MPNKIQEWLARAKPDHGPIGDLIILMREDPNIPDNFRSVNALTNYLRYRGASQRMISGAGYIWKRYHDWIRNHPIGAQS